MHVQAGREGRIPQQRPSDEKGQTLNILQLATTLTVTYAGTKIAGFYRVIVKFYSMYYSFLRFIAHTT